MWAMRRSPKQCANSFQSVALTVDAPSDEREPSGRSDPSVSANYMHRCQIFSVSRLGHFSVIFFCWKEVIYSMYIHSLLWLMSHLYVCNGITHIVLCLDMPGSIIDGRQDIHG